MNKMTLAICILMATGCAVKTDKPAKLAMKNPASVYCVEQGGKVDIIDTEKGKSGFCTLPSGERVEEWTLYHRAHK
ncbi:putative hemolysin [Erwinia phyllosphaerae]|uniref:putative hemolysin n=1 Tax=Erwinia phyllosphaerae TaxID=2853256 RepID=UPI001FEE7FFB|nr:DUF333 domain-containing protein [Erwinia phyllosphaerae]MBV4369028.1 DUF333 domain-containing protein [Erwinia phyllosphaerae]